MAGFWARGRYWHLATLVVAVVALALQLILVLLGQNVIDDSLLTAPLAERVRRLFSYFTIQSNLLVAISMAAILARRTSSWVFRVLRLTSLIGITVTGAVAAVALPPSPTYTAANTLCDRLLHIVVPVLALVGWIVFGPRGAVTRRDLLPSLVWPVLWLAATLALGPSVHWYPYPFLDVNRLGAASVALNCGLIAALFLLLAAAACWVDPHLPGRAPAQGAEMT